MAKNKIFVDSLSNFTTATKIVIEKIKFLQKSSPNRKKVAILDFNSKFFCCKKKKEENYKKKIKT
jgi:hypothetical protein